MSLSQLRLALLAADFKPHTHGLGSDLGALHALLSRRAKAIFYLMWSRANRATLGELLSANPWPENIVRYYRTLSEDERMEVLGFAGFYVHEHVHKIDLLTTPFGVAFHGRACLEAIGLQLDGAAILDELESADGNPPLRDYPRISNDSSTVNEGPAALQARVLWFDALRGAADRHVAPGWGGDTDPIILLNRSVTKVTVHDQIASVALPDAGYVRPLTILESRAVAITSLNLFYRLGADEYAAAEIALYMRTFYEPPGAYRDYRFFLDLMAGPWGTDGFVAAIESNGAAWLEQALVAVMVIGWYALHAPPLMDGEVPGANSNPVIRAILVLRAIEDAIIEDKPWESGVDMLDSIDASELGVTLGVRPIRKALDHCVAYVRAVRERNGRENSHTELAAHFDHILTVQEQQLGKRIASGYDSNLGMPRRGDFINAFADPDDEHLLIESYEPPAGVVRWFQLRELLLFRYVRPPDFWGQLGGYLCARTRVISCECGTLLLMSVPVYATRYTFRCDECNRVHEIEPETEVSGVEIDD